MTIEITVNPKITVNPRRWPEGFKQGLEGASRNWKRAIGASSVGLSAFLLTVFSSSPEYSMQMLSSGIKYWSLAFSTRLSGLLATSGYTGLSLTLLFSALVGVTMTNTAVQLRRNRLDFSSIGALPGFLAGGCASCGVGVLSLLGFGGVLASMPYEGNLLRLGGALLLAGLITRTGNPDTCKI
ncbi:hypothetical protein GKQ38_01780 [Candidatus Nanohaloarchaea archaeon]|nr:hypothetical protein GKQ38_01780 [Candidatus Nanohaloarchaea archaeon]